MSKLQNNFTTPEQSKRLLKLGVPANSADMWYVGSLGTPGKYAPFPSFSYHFDGAIYERDIPCWTVGRLIEIFEICTQHKFKRVQQTDDLVYLSPIEDVLMQIEHNACGFYDNTKWEINLLNK